MDEGVQKERQHRPEDGRLRRRIRIWIGIVMVVSIAEPTTSSWRFSVW
jgi:hypothetical protein